ncbi:HDOD domain-containing protein [Desulfobulbus alkaliphilus]|uniref:HDOD domain-containing protein n=1 Tax=Desulfobulbus alkaliphilus TaxID=869814 RepID=UPI0019652FD4|nr:HDOD domain-containing protein [Desulfobulbus alkaliphilus]MBM9536362.1 HDOD domain-containing protein [Desulfobulbus alkaliphilus]
MPQVLVQLIDQCHASEVNLQAIARIANKDTAICAKLLQLVNSAFIGARKAFTNLEQAVVYLGVDTVRNLAVSVSVQQVFRRVETNGLLSIDRFWHHSCLAALLSRKIAEHVGYPDPSEAYLAGLLHDIGKLLLWMAFPGTYAPLLLKGVRCHSGRLAFLEEEKLRINHCEAGAWLCEQWCLPALLADAIRYHHHPVEDVARALPLTRITALADLLAHGDSTDRECLETAGRYFNLQPAQVGQLYENLEEQLAQIADGLGIHIAKSAKTSHDREPESEESHKETTLGLIHRIRNITQLNGVLANLLQAENKEQIAAAAEQGLKILFNEDACLLLLWNKATRRLHCLTSADNKLARETAGLSFSLDRHDQSLPGQAMESLAPLFLFPGKGSEQTRPTLLDAQLLRLLGTEGMAVVPMNHREQRLGLLVVGLHKQSPLAAGGPVPPLCLLAAQTAIALYLDQVQAAQAEQIVIERLRSAGLVARKVAHEINNPLATLRNYLHIITGKCRDGEALGDELTIIDHELERISSLTLRLEKLADEEMPPHFEHVDLHSHIKELIALYKGSLPAGNQISLSYIPWETPLILDTDSGFLRQILTNLIDNALEALGTKGEIIVRSERHLDTILISVTDNGPGVDPTLQDDLFTAGASTKDGRHAGLGLAIGQQLAQRLGGALNCLSRRGRTVFTLALPA